MCILFVKKYKQMLSRMQAVLINVKKRPYLELDVLVTTSFFLRQVAYNFFKKTSLLSHTHSR